MAKRILEPGGKSLRLGAGKPPQCNNLLQFGHGPVRFQGLLVQTGYGVREPAEPPRRDHHPVRPMTLNRKAPLRPQRIDGRTLRSTANKTNILRTCRDLMKLGNFQPAAKIVAGAAGVSTKTVFTHFGSVGGLRCNALEDEATRAAVASLVIGTEGAGLSISTRDRVLRAVALGSLPEIGSRPNNRNHAKRILTHRKR